MKLRPLLRRPAPVALSALLLTCAAAHGSLIVHFSATPSGGGAFDYAFSVANSGPTEVAIVSLLDGPTDDALIAASLEAPDGFLANYDSGLGILDALEGTSLFASGSVIHGFRFRSEASPDDLFRRIEALDIFGNLIDGTVTVPEGGSVGPIALAGLAGLVFWQRRRRVTAPTS